MKQAFCCIESMKAVTLIFPHQLFKVHPAIAENREIYLIEEPLFFTQYRFHKQKIVLHRASMKAYCDYLLKRNYSVTYIDAGNQLSDATNLIAHLHSNGTGDVHIAETTDNWLQKKMVTSCLSFQINLHLYESPNFFTAFEEGNRYFDSKKNYFQTAFYIQQRKVNQVLVNAKGEPDGGKWSFDGENRERFPKNEKAPAIPLQKENSYITEAKAYVEKYFSHHYGQTEVFYYPVSFPDAEKWLEDFLHQRLLHFGKYEDAMVSNESFLYHSVLSPVINIGLLSPKQVIEQTLAFALANKTPLNSLEGFTRQVIGWREFIRIVYEREGSKQRTKNYWGFKKKIPASFWNGSTGIEPVDIVIRKILQTGYCHHIERLMVLGNFMLLCEFDPDEVYRWFMEMFVDAYDWVMVPNVYGMSQFADGGLMTTKPYISGSNYLLKMSDFKKGPWQEVWDGLFWRFMDTHRAFFLQNPRLGMLVRTFDKMPAEKKALHHLNAGRYLQQLEPKVSIKR